MVWSHSSPILGHLCFISVTVFLGGGAGEGDTCELLIVRHCSVLGYVNVFGKLFY